MHPLRTSFQVHAVRIAEKYGIKHQDTKYTKEWRPLCGLCVLVFDVVSRGKTCCFKLTP